MADHVAAWRLGQKHFDYGTQLQDRHPPLPRGLLIGESPSPNTNAELPLFPLPNNSAASRLVKYADIKPVEYLGRLVRMNLCDEEWSDRRAIVGYAKALSYLLDVKNFYDGKPLRVLLLGERVARAWGCDGPFGYAERQSNPPGLCIAWIPHPSGRCHLYFERKNQLRARRSMQWAIGERAAP